MSYIKKTAAQEAAENILKFTDSINVEKSGGGSDTLTHLLDRSHKDFPSAIQVLKGIVEGHITRGASLLYHHLRNDWLVFKTIEDSSYKDEYDALLKEGARVGLFTEGNPLVKEVEKKATVHL